MQMPHELAPGVKALPEWPADRIVAAAAVVGSNDQRFSPRPRRGRSRLGLPAVSVPAGMSVGGLPLALQLVARPFAEARLLQVADALQRDTGWHPGRPPTPVTAADAVATTHAAAAATSPTKETH